MANCEQYLPPGPDQPLRIPVFKTDLINRGTGEEAEIVRANGRVIRISQAMPRWYGLSRIARLIGFRA